MFIREYWCKPCDLDFELIFGGSSEATDTAECPACSKEANWKPSSFQTSCFRPFVTRHIFPDGRRVEVTSRNHLNELMRINGLRHSPLNDTAEGKADYREFDKSNFKNQKRKSKIASGIKVQRRGVPNFDAAEEKVGRERAASLLTPQGDQWLRRLQQSRKS